MSKHITTELVTTVARRAVEADETSPTAWESLDKLTQFLLMERVTAFLADAIPALIEHGWTPPEETNHG